jgi:hypothetical protein
VPWYVTAFLKLINPFIDPVTKSKIKYNEPLTDHVPATQLMAASGGKVDFKYDHSIYWPALENLTEIRRQQRRERWQKGGKLIGESEIYLWGGEEGSVGAGAAQDATAAALRQSRQLRQLRQSRVPVVRRRSRRRPTMHWLMASTSLTSRTLSQPSP